MGLSVQLMRIKSFLSQFPPKSSGFLFPGGFLRLFVFMRRTRKGGHTAVAGAPTWPKEQLLQEAYELYKQRKRALTPKDSSSSSKPPGSTTASSSASGASGLRRESSGAVDVATKLALVPPPPKKITKSIPLLVFCGMCVCVGHLFM